MLRCLEETAPPETDDDDCSRIGVIYQAQSLCD